MIIARIRKVHFTKDDYNQTVAFQRLGERLEQSNPECVDAAIADNQESAVKMLRKNLQEYIGRSALLTADPGWFSFEVATTEIIEKRFSMAVWSGDNTQYPAVGDVE